jgi:hypothetical protein
MFIGESEQSPDFNRKHECEFIIRNTETLDILGLGRFDIAQFGSVQNPAEISIEFDDKIHEASMII